MSFELVNALNDLLKTGFDQVRFRHTDQDPGQYVAPQFFVGAIPPKRKSNDPLNEERVSDPPFMVTRMATGEDTGDNSLINVETLCGIYTAEGVEGGENDIANMIMRARRLILETQILESKYELQFPLKWYVGDPDQHHQQPHPFYEGVIKTTWKLPVIERKLATEDEEKIYG